MARRITVTNVKQTFNFSPITNIGNRIEIGETKSGGENIVLASPQGSAPAIELDYGDAATATGMIAIKNDAGTQGKIGIGGATSGLIITNTGSGTNLAFDSDNGGQIAINEGGFDTDIRMESDTNANHFYSDAGLFSGVGAFGLGAVGANDSFITVDPPAITALANSNFAKINIRGSAATTVPTGTAAVVSSLYVNEPNITATGTVSDAYSIVVAAAPTEGSRNGALWVASGTSRFDDNVSIAVAGKGLFVKEGTNATMGVVTLSGGAGTAIVYTTAFTANSRVFAMHQNTSGTLGTVRVTASSNLVSFTLSTATNDTSVVAWWIIQQA